LRRIENRVVENHKLPFSYNDDVIKQIVERCTEVESGTRIVDAILTNTVLNSVSNVFLIRMMQGEPVNRVHVSVDSEEFTYEYRKNKSPFY